MCFLRSSAVLLVVAAFAAARPAFLGNYGDDDGFGGYSASPRGFGYIGGSFGSGSNSQNLRSFVRGNGFDNSDDFYGSNSASARGDGSSGSGMSGFSPASGNGFNGFSGKGFSGFGSFSSVPGVIFAFPSLTSVSYSKVPQQNDDLATLAVLCALLADSENYDDSDNNNNDAAAVQTVSRQTYSDTSARDANKQASNVAFVPVVTVPAAAAEQQKTTKIVKTTIETDGSVPNIPGLNGDLADIAAGSGSDSFDANADASGSSRRSYSQAASSSSATAGSSSRLY